MHSHNGDRYLRIDPMANVSSTASGDSTGNVDYAVKVDFAGDLDNDFFTALVKFKDVSVGFPDFETRVQITFYYNGTTYHLQAVGVDEELRAIPEDKAAMLTDKSDVFSPERLKYEHHLFFVFESVKFRYYYLGTKGSGESKFVNIHSEAYRDSETLFKMIDPGNEIAGASFGAVVTKRRRRAINSLEMQEMFPGTMFVNKSSSTAKQKTTMSSIRAYVKIPVLETFTLCFWIKTKDEYGQIFAIIYDNETRPRIDVYINKGSLVLALNGRIRKTRRCGISDGRWHHICVSLQSTSRMFVYRDGKRIHETRFRYLRSPNISQRKTATVFLGRRKGANGKFYLNGDLTQVNIWDAYPLFRIKRIATNSACGGGNMVQWKDFLKNTSSRDVLLYSCDDCPKRVGYNFNKKVQNNLV